MATPTVIDPARPEGLGQYPAIPNLVPSYIKIYDTRTIYKQLTGQDAPPYDPRFPIKNWVDTLAPTDFQTMTYNTAHLDSTFQHPVMSQISMPSFIASSVNLPPDSGPIPPSTAGQYLTPVRELIQASATTKGERFAQGAMNAFAISVINLDIFDDQAQNPTSTPGTSVGGFTDEDRDLLKRIATAVRA